jgi:hypothetical protein
VLRNLAAASGALAVALVLGGAGARADDLDGFEDDDMVVEFDDEDAGPAVPDRWWDIDGSLALSTSINYLDHQSPTGTDYTGISRLRTRLNLQLDFELPHDFEMRLSPYIWYDFNYLIHGRDNYTDKVLAKYEWEGNFQDSYIEGPILKSVDIKIGRQVVNWGRSDSVRVLDVLNPIDNREPGRADIEDLRWAVTMAKIDWHVGRWTFTGIAIPELRFSTLPPYGSDFNPSPIPGPSTNRPDHFSDTEFAAAAKGIFEGWDISFHFADVYEDIPRLKQTGPNPFVDLEFRHDRLKMGGAGANWTTGSWLFKTEAAYFYGFEFFTDPGDKKSSFDAMLGVEYYGFSETTIAIEVVNRHIFGWDNLVLGFPDALREDNTQYAIRLTRDWLNARLSTTVLAILFGYKVQDGAVIRLQADYTIRDALVVGGGLLMYQQGELPPLNSWGDNDRVFIELKYSF